MFGLRLIGATFLLSVAGSAQAGTCGSSDVDCDGDGLLNEVDLCPFTPSTGNAQTLVTYAGSTTRLPTGADCTAADAFVDPSAIIGHGVELGSGAAIFEHADIGDYTTVGGSGQVAVVGRRAALVAAPTPALGTVFTSGLIGGGAVVGADPSIVPLPEREGDVVDSGGLTAGRSTTIGFGVTFGQNVTLGYAVTIGPGTHIDNNAIIGNLAVIGWDAVIGENSVVARKAIIGDYAQLGNNVIVGPETEIGANAIIGGTDSNSPAVRIRKNTTIGRCAGLEPGIRLGRGISVGAYAQVKQGVRLSANTQIGRGGVACTPETAPEGRECPEEGFYGRGSTVDADMSNTYCPPIVDPTINVDLVASDFTVQTPVPAGFTASVAVTVTNAGLDASGVTELALKWSSTTTFSEPADCTVTVPSLAPGESTELTTACVANAASGPAYLVSRADPENLIVERDESNNDLASNAVTLTSADSACGGAAGFSSADAPTTDLCTSGVASDVSGDGPFDWTCTDTNGASASCSSNHECDGGTESWTVSGSICSVELPTTDHGFGASADDTQLPTTGARTYTCDQGTWMGTGAGTCVTAVDAVCGGADGLSSDSAPTTSLCDAGNASAVGGSGPYTWSCGGIDGGDDISCSSDRSCLSGPESWDVAGSTCSATLVSAVHGGSSSADDAGLPTSGNRTYTCDQGSWNGSGPGSCVTAVDAVCGTADGQNTPNVPSTGLCADGNATSVSGAGPFTWDCTGINGGDNTSCASNHSCDSGSQSWTIAGSTCSASILAVDHGGTQSLNDGAIPTTGDRTFTCDQGTWNGSGGTCNTAVNGSCGSADGQSTASTPSAGLCADGNATSVSGSGPYTWSCTGIHGGSTDSCSSDRSCDSGTQSWTLGGSTCSASTLADTHGDSQPLTDSGLPTTGSRTFSCSQGSWGGSGGTCVTAVNAVCGSANGGDSTSAPGAAAQCSVGSSSGVSGAGPYTWTCSGSNGGSSVSCASNRSCVGDSLSWTIGGSSCSATTSTDTHGDSQALTDSGLPTTGSRTFSCSQGSWSGSGGTCVTAVNAVCGSANGGSTTGAPLSASQCSVGSASSVSGSGPYSWTCSGSNGGSNASCSSNRSCSRASQSWTIGGSSCSQSTSGRLHAQSQTITDSGLPTTGSRTFSCSQGSWRGSGGTCVTATIGTCGTANGSNVYSAPSSSTRCASGSASGVRGSGPYTWTCSGSNGGSSQSCAANRSCYGAAQSWTISGSTCGASTSNRHSGSTHAITDSGLPTTGSRTFSCSQGSWSGSGGSCVTAVNGVCGSANGGSTTSAPSSSIRCSVGSTSGVSGSGPYTWTCSGSNGGSTASCSSNRSCSTQTLSWSSCTASRSGQSHGYSAGLRNTRSGYTGSATATCFQGNWLTSNTSCSASQVCTPNQIQYGGVCGDCHCGVRQRQCNSTGSAWGRCMDGFGCQPTNQQCF